MPTIAPISSSLLLKHTGSADEPKAIPESAKPEIKIVADDSYDAPKPALPLRIDTLTQAEASRVLLPSEHNAWIPAEKVSAAIKLLSSQENGTWMLRPSSLSAYDDQVLGIRYFVYAKCDKAAEGNITESRIAWVNGHLYDVAATMPPRPNFNVYYGTIYGFARPEMVLKVG